MKLMFSDARIWRYVVSALSKFIDYAQIKVGPESGLIMKAMDPSKTALVEFIIPKEAFTAFEVNEEHTLVLSLKDAGKILRTAEKDDKLGLDWTEASITFLFERRGNLRSFTIPLQAVTEAEEIPELSLELRNTYRVPSDVLYDSISSIEDVGEVLRVEGNEKELILKAVSDLGEAEVVLSLEDGTLEEVMVENPGFSVSFGTEYFSLMKQPVRLSSSAVLRLDSEMPCHMELNYVEGTKLNYYVAPRVE